LVEKEFLVYLKLKEKPCYIQVAEAFCGFAAQKYSTKRQLTNCG